MCFTNGGYYLYLGLTRGLPTELMRRRCSAFVLVGQNNNYRRNSEDGIDRA